MKDFAQKVAFITGGANGIGLGMAKVFLEAGMRVVIADIRQDALDRACAELGGDKGLVLPIRMDVADSAAWGPAADLAEAHFGQVDVLCNNAGIGSSRRALEDIPPADWLFAINVNLNSIYFGCHTFIPRMKTRGTTSHIINTASLSGLFTNPKMSEYHTTKFGIIGLSQALKSELAAFNIGVSVLCPGMVRSDIFENSKQMRPSSADGKTIAAVDVLKTGMSAGTDPVLVGRQVLNAVSEDRFYIFTHPEYRPIVEENVMAMLADFKEPADAGHTDDISLLQALRSKLSAVPAK